MKDRIARVALLVLLLAMVVVQGWGLIGQREKLREADEDREWRDQLESQRKASARQQEEAVVDATAGQLDKKGYFVVIEQAQLCRDCRLVYAKDSIEARQKALHEYEFSGWSGSTVTIYGKAKCLSVTKVGGNVGGENILVMNGVITRPVPEGACGALGLKPKEIPRLVGWTPPQWKPSLFRIGWPVGVKSGE